MFGIDFSEILVIFGIALVVLGPEKLPKLANTIGRWIGRARGMARQFREQLEQETNTLKHGVDLSPELSGLDAAVKAASRPYLSAPTAAAAEPVQAAAAAAYVPYNAPHAEGKAPTPLTMDAAPGEAPPAQLALPMSAPEPAGVPLPRPTSAQPAVTAAEAPIALHESVWPDDGPA